MFTRKLKKMLSIKYTPITWKLSLDGIVKDVTRCAVMSVVKSSVDLCHVLTDKRVL